MIRDLNNRTKLEEAIPLSSPLLIHFGTNNVCNFKCKFCPTGDDELLKKYNVKKGFMKYELFCKCIDELKEFPNKIKKIMFHIDGEPLLHPDLPKMIKYAKKSKVSNNLTLFTNGALLTPELSRKIIDAGIQFIQVSIEGVSDEKYLELTGTKTSYNNILANTAYLYCNRGNDCFVTAKIIDCGLSEGEKEKFLNDFKNVTDECHIENIISFIDESIKDTSLGKKSGLTTDGIIQVDKKVCTNPFYTMSVNFDGRVSACTCDWSKRTIIGNVNNNTLKEIWNGEKLNNFRKIQLMKEKETIPACRDCKSILNQIDNIDKYADEILKRI